MASLKDYTYRYNANKLLYFDCLSFFWRYDFLFFISGHSLDNTVTASGEDWLLSRWLNSVKHLYGINKQENVIY